MVILSRALSPVGKTLADPLMYHYGCFCSVIDNIVHGSQKSASDASTNTDVLCPASATHCERRETQMMNNEKKPGVSIVLDLGGDGNKQYILLD